MKSNIFYFYSDSHSHSHLKKIIVLIIIIITIIIVLIIIIILLYNLLDITSDNTDLPRYVTKKWIEVYDQSEKNYNPNKKIRIKTPMLRSDLCDFSDAYIILLLLIQIMQKEIKQ